MSDKKISREKKKPQTPKKKVSAKVIKHTTMATVLTVFFIAIVVMINIVASIIFDRYPLTFDLTENNKYSISQQSIDYVKGIEGEITVTILAEEEVFASINEYTVQAQELLKRYKEYNPDISIRYVDLLKNPEIASDYPDVTLKDYDIIFETYVTDKDSGEKFHRVKVVNLAQIVSWNQEFISQLESYYGDFDAVCEMYGAVNVVAAYGGYITGSSAEQAFTSALMNITDPDPVEIAFLTGRDEVSDFSRFRSLLSANGYTVSTINITTEEIPSNIDVVVVGAPAQDYLDSEVKKLSDFLINDGMLEKDMIYIASVQQAKTPNLDEFLEEYGIVIEEAIVFENNSSYVYADLYTNEYINIGTIASENYLQDINTESLILAIKRARPVKLLFEEANMMVTEKFLTSTDQGYTFDYEDTSEPLSKGVQNYIAVSSKAVFIGDDTGYSNVMVVASETFFDDTILQASQFQNSEYIISLLNGMTKKSSTGFVVETKTILGDSFDLTEKQASILKWTFQAIIPLLVLVAGLVVYKVRKNK